MLTQTQETGSALVASLRALATNRAFPSALNAATSSVPNVRASLSPPLPHSLSGAALYALERMPTGPLPCRARQRPALAITMAWMAIATRSALTATGAPTPTLCSSGALQDMSQIVRVATTACSAPAAVVPTSFAISAQTTTPTSPLASSLSASASA